MSTQSKGIDSTDLPPAKPPGNHSWKKDNYRTNQCSCCGLMVLKDTDGKWHWSATSIQAPIYEEDVDGMYPMSCEEVKMDEALE